MRPATPAATSSACSSSLGLLGTFWGLLDTIRSVGDTINALDTKSADSALIFEELKSGLSAPLSGMGTAFASSLFGLSGSLVLGFLELQASQAHNRFYNELEDWLSGITELTPGTTHRGRLQRGNQPPALWRAVRSAALAERDRRPARQINARTPTSPTASTQLVTQMRREQEIIRQWADEQSAQHGELLTTIRDFLENRRRGRS